jgi:hypothetical protein
MKLRDEKQHDGLLTELVIEDYALAGINLFLILEKCRK